MVGVRELRQNLSVHLRRVKDGETLRVTERGRPVAVLAPLPEPSDSLARMVAEGRAIPADVPVDALPPPLPNRGGPTLSAVVSELRGDRV